MISRKSIILIPPQFPLYFHLRTQSYSTKVFFFKREQLYCNIYFNVLLFSHHFRYVFVECRPGLYGFTCSVNCSSHCYKKDCDQYSKECLYGCTPGYQTPNCVMRKMYLQPSLFKFSQ